MTDRSGPQLRAFGSDQDSWKLRGMRMVMVRMSVGSAASGSIFAKTSCGLSLELRKHR